MKFRGEYMKIGFASDHRGYALKQQLMKELSKEYDVVDYGTHSEESTDYPDYAFLLGETYYIDSEVKENIKEEIGTFGAYWTSSISKYFSESAGATYFYWRMKDTGSSGERYKGFPVRPVAE